MAEDKTINVAEDFKRVHEAFEQINFNAFDYDSIKSSLIEYMKLYYSEDFNDYIESSEIISIIETFAYVGELLAYRIDLNTHENFISQARRKESVLRLARLISYNASRRQSARGLVKIESVSTSQSVRDSLNTELRNKVIRWNDPNNSNWQEQFFTVINLMLKDQYGSPQKSETSSGINYDLYRTEMDELSNGVFSYNANTSLKSVRMELTSTDLGDTGPEESTPNPEGDFSIIYSNDGLGLGSNNTGFMIYTVQGELIRNPYNFQQPIPNRAVKLPQEGVNQTDVSVIQVEDEASNTIVEVWEKVDSSTSDGLYFKPSDGEKIYEVVTLDGDLAEVRFGDAAFGTIPVGPFVIWARSSEADPIIIPRAKVQEEEFSFTYADSEGNTQTANLRFSLISSLTNAASSEDIERIRRTAPSVYYTQDRMVNARDYNEFLFQDPAVLKLKSVNRTFSGQTKYQDFQDASGNYQNIKLFGDDLRMILEESYISRIYTPAEGANGVQIIEVLIEPLLAIPGVQDHLRKIQGINTPRDKFREAIEYSTLEYTGSSINASVLDPYHPYDPLNPDEHPRHNQEKTEIQGRVDGRYFGTPGSEIGNFSADGLIHTETNKNTYILDFHIPAAAANHSTPITMSSFTVGAFIEGSSSGAVGIVESVHPIEVQSPISGIYIGGSSWNFPNNSIDIGTGNIYVDSNLLSAPSWSAINASTISVSSINASSGADVELRYNEAGWLILSAPSTASTSFDWDDELVAEVDGVEIGGYSGPHGIVLSASSENAIFTYQLQDGSGTVAAPTAATRSLGRHEGDTTTGAYSNDAFGIGYDSIRDQYYTIDPENLGPESADFSKTRKYTPADDPNSDNSWIIRVLPIRISGKTNYKIGYRSVEIVSQGITTDFYYQNDRSIENSETGLVVEDMITALGVNFDIKERLPIGENLLFPVLRQPLDDITALLDRDKLIIKKQDTDQNGIPDDPNEFNILVDHHSPEFVMGLDGRNNNLSAIPPEIQIARDAAMVYGVEPHVFSFENSEVVWQEQESRWGEGAFVQTYIDQSETFSPVSGISSASATDVVGKSAMWVFSSTTFDFILDTNDIGGYLYIDGSSITGSNYEVVGTDSIAIASSISVSSIQIVYGESISASVVTVKFTLPFNDPVLSSGSLGSAESPEIVFGIPAASSHDLPTFDPGNLNLVKVVAKGGTISIFSPVTATVTQVGITTPINNGLSGSAISLVDRAINLTMASSIGLPEEPDFTIEAYIAMSDASSLNIYDQHYTASANTGYKFEIEDAGASGINTVKFTLGGRVGASAADIVATMSLPSIAITPNNHLADGKFRHLAATKGKMIPVEFAPGITLSGIKPGDRVSASSGAQATIYNTEEIGETTGNLWIKDLSPIGSEFSSSVLLSVSSLQADGDYRGSSINGSVISAMESNDYLRAYIDGIGGTVVSIDSSFEIIREDDPILNPESSDLKGKMMNGLISREPREDRPNPPRAFCDGISITREARYGGNFVPGRVFPQSVFYRRVDTLSNLEPVLEAPTPLEINIDYEFNDAGFRLIREYIGRDDINFLWTHFTPRNNLIDPSKTNIIDMYVHTEGYQKELDEWILRNDIFEPMPPSATSADLAMAFGGYLEKGMLSDTIIMHSGKIKYLFGAQAASELRSKFRVIKKTTSLTSDDQLRGLVLSVITEYFDIANWNFGLTFYFTELASKIHQALPKDVQSVVLVPSNGDHRFGDLFQVTPESDEILQSAARSSEIEVIEDLTRQNIRRTED